MVKEGVDLRVKGCHIPRDIIVQWAFPVDVSFPYSSENHWKF